MKFTAFIICTICIVLITGCAGSYFTFDNARAVKVGMTTAELQKLMGKPFMVNTAGTKQIWNYTFATGFGSARSVSFVVVGDKISEVPIIPDSYGGKSAPTIQTASPTP